MRSGEVNSGVASLAQAVVIQQSEMSVSQWAGGSTTQLAIYPPHSSVAAQDFLWRFSSATVEQSGAFTRFPQHQRLLALRQGAGFTFTVEAKLASAEPTAETPVPNQQAEVTSQQQTLRFAGCCTSSARLLNGAITDINLMLAAGYSGNLLSRPLSQHWQPLLLARPEHSTLLLWSDEIAMNIRYDDQQLRVQCGDLCILADWPLAQVIEICMQSAVESITSPSVVIGWLNEDAAIHL